MRYSQLTDLENTKQVFMANRNLDSVIDKAILSNMMSKVLLAEDDDFLLITRLNTEQVLRTADIVNASAVLITDTDSVSNQLKDLAQELDISLYYTPRSLPTVSDHFLSIKNLSVEIY